MKNTDNFRALIVSEDGASERLSALLAEAGFAVSACTQTIEEALRLTAGQKPALIAYDPAVSAEDALDRAKQLADQSDAGVILLTDADAFPETRLLAAEAGVIAMERPVSRDHLIAAAWQCVTIRTRMRAILDENARLRDRLYEEEMLRRAKRALIKYLNMTEPQAHRFIEKTAMDRRITRLAVAKSILKNYAL